MDIGQGLDGIWLDDGGGVQTLLAFEGEQAPGLAPGVGFGIFRHPLLTAAGEVLIEVFLGEGNEGIWRWTPPGTLALQVASGMHPPGTPAGTTLLGFGPDPLANDSGEVVIQAKIAGPDVDTEFGTNDRGVWTTAGGNGLALVLREGDPRPTNPLFVWGNNSWPRILNGGGILLGSTVLRNLDGTFTSVWQAGTPAPGVPGAVFETGWLPDQRVANVVLPMRLEVGVGGVTTANDRGFWRVEPDGTLSLLAREGDSGWNFIPGAETRFPRSWPSNDSGEVAYITLLEQGPGGIDASNDYALFKVDALGGLNLLVQKSDPVPGVAGYTFGELRDVVLNNRGDIVLEAVIVDSGGGSDSAFVHIAPDGSMRTLLVEDQLFDLGGGNVQQVDFARLPIEEDRQVLNDAGEFLLEMSYFDSALAQSFTHLVVMDLAASLEQCGDGEDNDNDGLVDFPDDPGCATSADTSEDPACQDGINNDSDIVVDFDGGQSIHGACVPGPGGCPTGVSDPDDDGVADPDPTCVGRPWFRRESSANDCGVGGEWFAALGALLLVRMRRRESR